METSEKGKVVAAFAFGAPASIKPNQRISQIASKKARELDAPVYTQLDIKIEDGIKVYQVTEKPCQPPTTLRMAQEIANWAKDQDIAVIWVAAAEPHLWRVVRDLKKEVEEVRAKIEIKTCEEIQDFANYLWFSYDSFQPWTRSREAWNRRELILELIPYFIYRLFA